MNWLSDGDRWLWSLTHQVMGRRIPRIDLVGICSFLWVSNLIRLNAFVHHILQSNILFVAQGYRTSLLWKLRLLILILTSYLTRGLVHWVLQVVLSQLLALLFRYFLCRFNFFLVIILDHLQIRLWWLTGSPLSSIVLLGCRIKFFKSF